ncbi:MAG: hypothetical protein H6711_03915 [Myxococcales bacterium]|nr:hypothetical protein [Myxococcales bacterium]
MASSVTEPAQVQAATPSLRPLAVVWAIYTALSLAVMIAREQTQGAISGTIDEAFAESRGLLLAATALNVLVAGALAASLGLAAIRRGARARPLARPLAWTGCVAALASVVLTSLMAAAPLGVVDDPFWPGESLTDLLWIAEAQILHGALLLALLAASAGRRPSPWTLAFAALALLHVITLASSPWIVGALSDRAIWPLRALWLAVNGLFVVAAWREGARRSPAPIAGPAGAPLALLARVIVARVVLGALAQIVVAAATASGSVALGRALLDAALIVDLGVAMAMVLALRAYLGIERDARDGLALGVAITVTLVGPGLELWSSSLAVEVLDAAAWDATLGLYHAAQAQATLRTLALASAALGVLGSLAIAQAAQRTAIWLEDVDSVERGSRIKLRIVLLALGGVVLGWLATSARGGLASALALGGALVVLVGALVVLVDLLGLLRTLASQLDDRRVDDREH